ncbi:MAG: cytochrome c biogenesis protein ResB [Pseudomonadota bacterium]
MTSTTGIELSSGSRAWRDAVELLSSMRFSISLLTLICIASIIGTVVKQHEPATNYANQFGPFWAELFGRVSLYAVYSAWWFLLILAFLVVSTSLCIARNAPKIIADLKNSKVQLREQSLQAFHHKGSATLAGESPEAAFARVSALLKGSGWKAKAQVRSNGTMIAARRGSANKLGYIAAHSAIVLVCLGGLFDGDLIVRLQMALFGKSAYAGGGLIRDVKPEHRLSPNNPTFRGNLLVPEGQRAGVAILTMQDGVVLQDLPFEIELKKFIVDYYATGMPKLFASEIVIHDRDSGQAIPATVKVNEPAFHRGVAIYQSSFDDGGSTVKLRATPLAAVGQPFDIEGTVGGNSVLTSASEQLTLEFTGLRVINVENLTDAQVKGGSATDVRKVDLATTLDDHLGSGAKLRKEKTLRNVGPSISYKLRDTAGQAREYQTYMLPLELEGKRVFLAGVRDTPQEAFRYLRIPVDDKDSADGWLRLRRALDDPALRSEAVRRYVALATPPDKPEMTQQLTATASRALGLFAGAEAPTKDKVDEASRGGLQALGQFLESSVPAAERERISEVLLRILNGSLFELANVAREKAGLPPLKTDDATQTFMTQAVLALSDSLYYPAPVLLQLADFKQVQASVFQVARAPGHYVVYLGAMLLILGVFAMLYVRERRLWVWIAPAAEGGTQLSMALSTNRRTLDVDHEFEQMKQAVFKGTQ